MKIIHSAIKSPFFELVKTLEVDIQLGEESWATRIEILQSKEESDHFRCRVWELELHRLTPSFPRDENDLPAHVTDASIFVERNIALRGIDYPTKEIIAPDVNSALETVISDLKRFLMHVTGEPCSEINTDYGNSN